MTLKKINITDRMIIIEPSGIVLWDYYAITAFYDKVYRHEEGRNYGYAENFHIGILFTVGTSLFHTGEYVQSDGTQTDWAYAFIHGDKWEGIRFDGTIPEEFSLAQTEDYFDLMVI